MADDARERIAALQDYYRRRAPEYDDVYARPDPSGARPHDELAPALMEALRGRSVLEVACGTGHWTAVAAPVVQRIVATAGAPEMLAIARAKALPPDRVELRLADAYALEAVPGAFDAALAVFWLSHVPRACVADFLRGLHARLQPGSVVFMADAVYIPEDEGEMMIPPGGEDAFARRPLADGSVHAVLKNYYDEADLRRIFAPFARNLEFHVGQTVWWVRYASIVEQPAP